MNKFTLFWLTGKAEVIEGNDIANACNRNGISQGALAALDFYAQGDIRNDYTWNPTTRSWDASIAKLIQDGDYPMQVGITDIETGIM